MRIRSRWPPLPSAPDLQSSTVHPLPPSQSRAVHRHNYFSVDDDLTPTCDFPTHPRRSADQNEDQRSLSKTADPDGDGKCSYSMHLGVSQDQEPSIGVGEDDATAEGNTSIPPCQRMVFEPSSSRLETSAGSSISSSLSHQEHWCEEDKVIPIKKRRGSFKSEVDNTFVVATEKEMWMEGREKTPRKSGCKRKGAAGVDNDGDEEHAVEKNGAKKRGKSSSSSSSRKGKGREGWRCSRANGRGWRCCQPTLVGYSLCEHHLRKGRLRSVNSVPSKSTVTNVKCEKVNTNMCLEEDHDKDENEEDDDKERMVGAKKKKKKKRVGVVKARSLSSLLGQTLPSSAPLAL